jgi:nucleotide-binding universal stress UspA family protein
MFKHILVPTDGSKLSGKAIRTAVRLAAATGAKVTGIYVVPPYLPPMYGEAVMYGPVMSQAKYRRISKREGQKALAALEIEAQTAGVGYAGSLLFAQNPWEGIVRTAKSRKCDLVVMASHGRRGLAGLLLGSETTKVLTHSRVPVLVCR